MPKPQQVPTLVQDFSGGLNTKWALNATQLEANQSPNLVNVDYTSRFAFTKRRGVVLLGNLTTGTAPIRSLYTLVKRDGTEILMRTMGTKAQYLLGTTWTDITGATALTSDLKFDFETNKDIVFFSNGTDAFMSWDGTSAVTAYAGNPKATILTSAFLRLWAAGTTSDPALLYYSAPDDFTNFASAGAGNTSFQYAIKSMMPFFDSSGNEILQVYLLNGDLFHVGFDTTGTIFKKRVKRNVGSINHRASKQTENTNFILDTQNQVRGIGYEQYVSDVRSAAKSVLIDSYLSTLDVTDSAAAYFDKNYLLSAKAPGAGSNNVILIFDENYNSWRVYSGLGANEFSVYQKKLVLASSSDTNVYQFNSAYYSDNGIPINALYQTRDLNFDEEMDKKQCRFIKVQGLISKGCVIPVRGFYDGQTASTGFTKTILGSGPYVKSTPASAFGSNDFGGVPFAGFGGTDSSITMYPFQVTMSVPDTTFDSLRLEFSNTQKDVDFVIFSIKPYVDVLTGSRNDTSSFI